MNLDYKTIKSPVGQLTLVASEKALVWLGWGDGFRDLEGQGVVLKEEVAAGGGGNKIIAATQKQLDDYFQGKIKKFNIPLAPHGTPFQLKAWAELSKIPYGKTISYGEQAARIGRPRAFRAVGSANGKNPIAIVVPCHRVIGGNGGLAGYGGGLSIKQKLLTIEGRYV